MSDDIGLSDPLSTLRFFLEHTSSGRSERMEKGDPVPSAVKLPTSSEERIALPEPELLPDRQVNFLELVELRTTQRQFAEDPLTLQDLSYLLWCSQGVKTGLSDGGSMRNVPSAGARHPFETYLYLQRVEGLEPGFYQFLAFEHALSPCRELSDAEGAGKRFLSAFRTKAVAETSAAIFVWAAEADRMLYRFGTRGIRYLYLDAGHVCQNLYLAAETLRLGACALGAFDDATLNEALHLDGEDGEFAVYAAAVGRPQSSLWMD